MVVTKCIFRAWSGFRKRRNRIDVWGTEQTGQELTVSLCATSEAVFSKWQCAFLESRETQGISLYRPSKGVRQSGMFRDSEMPAQDAQELDPIIDASLMESSIEEVPRGREGGRFDDSLKAANLEKAMGRVDSIFEPGAGETGGSVLESSGSGSRETLIERASCTPSDLPANVLQSVVSTPKEGWMHLSERGALESGYPATSAAEKEAIDAVAKIFGTESPADGAVTADITPARQAPTGGATINTETQSTVGGTSDKVREWCDIRDAKSKAANVEGVVDGEVGPSSTGVQGGGEVGLDSFDLMKVLGRGTFGTVTLVRHRLHQRLFAMKVLKKRELLKKRQLLHTATERAVLEQLKHPFLTKLEFAFQSSGRLYLVMNYCSGGELFFWMQHAQDRRFSTARTRLYAAEIFLGLKHLHQHNVVYRDLKVCAVAAPRCEERAAC
jgi:hypothetical protein